MLSQRAAALMPFFPRPAPWIQSLISLLTATAGGLHSRQALLTFPLFNRLFLRLEVGATLQTAPHKHVCLSVSATGEQQPSKNRPLWSREPASVAQAVASVHLTRPA